MPNYDVGGTTVRRKNFYMPCIISARVDDMEPDEYAKMLKATYWADNITNAEWPVVLDHDEATKVNRSRLKKKGAGWIMALARIALLNPDLFRAMAEQARTMYADQVEQDFPEDSVIPALAGLPKGKPNDVLLTFWHDLDDLQEMLARNREDAEVAEDA